MNSTVRTILLWVVILVAAVGLWNFVERTQESSRLINLTELLTGVETGQIAEVSIAGSQVTGRLIKGNQSFRTTIPSDYTTIYDKLTAAKIKVTIIPPTQPFWPTAIVSWLIPMLMAFGLGWLCASRAGRMRAAA